MIPKIRKVYFVGVLAILLLSSSYGWAGNKRIMSISAAKDLAERAIVESVHGLKVRAT